jgi:hypothetical protein
MSGHPLALDPSVHRVPSDAQVSCYFLDGRPRLDPGSLCAGLARHKATIVTQCRRKAYKIGQKRTKGQLDRPIARLPLTLSS